jgi:hypothetical protein
MRSIEIFFSILARRLLEHGAFTSEDNLAQQMLAFIETYNQTTKPFKWTYTEGAGSVTQHRDATYRTGH